jgi:hypothetical protein
MRILSVLGLTLMLTGCGSSGESSNSSAPTGLRVVVQGSTATFAHSDGLSGQTARSVTAGVRRLELLDESAGTSFVLLDGTGTADVTVSYDEGASTTLATVTPSAIVPGHYTKARMIQDWSRFEIDATLHEASGATAGALRALQVTSDGTVVEGETRAAGHYEHQFVAAGHDDHFAGDDALLPEHSTTAGAEAVVENGLWAVYFPVDVTITQADADLVIVVNMDGAFRWTDVPGGGNQESVYDFAPPLYEPVEQFGGNRFDVSYMPR